jgi:hypothetical protein
MGKGRNDPPSETVRLLERLRARDRRALADLFERHRDRLRRMVELRMDVRLQGRIDASDVLQDGFIDVTKRVESYLSDSRLPVFLWLRLVVSDRLASYHRRHLGTALRDADLGVSESHIKVAVHRYRSRYRLLLRDEIARTLDDPADIDEEITALIAALTE